MLLTKQQLRRKIRRDDRIFVVVVNEEAVHQIIYKYFRGIKHYLVTETLGELSCN